MSLIRDIKHRKPAKQIEDMDIPETAWKPDFDIVDRYQGFANELMRIGLLGIGGYCFLIKQMLTDSNSPCYALIKENRAFVAAGAISLGLSLIFVLIHRFYSTYCLYHQILIIRSLKRLKNNWWSEEDKKAEHEFLKRTRDIQRHHALLGRGILIASAFFFGVGFAFVIGFFVNILLAAK